MCPPLGEDSPLPRSVSRRKGKSRSPCTQASTPDTSAHASALTAQLVSLHRARSFGPGQLVYLSHGLWCCLSGRLVLRTVRSFAWLPDKRLCYSAGAFRNSLLSLLRRMCACMNRAATASYGQLRLHLPVKQEVTSLLRAPEPRQRDFVIDVDDAGNNMSCAGDSDGVGNSNSDAG